MCTKANISGHKTNHSLRATVCSELFQAGMPEKVIQQRTGHLSLQGMHHYERTTSQQQQAVSRILNSDEDTTFEREVAVVGFTQTVTSAHAKISMSARQIPRLPSCAPAGNGGVGPMQFNGCSVVIYQGNSTPSAPPALPCPTRPTLPHTWNGDELQDLDMDSFCDL